MKFSATTLIGSLAITTVMAMAVVKADEAPADTVDNHGKIYPVNSEKLWF